MKRKPLFGIGLSDLVKSDRTIAVGWRRLNTAGPVRRSQRLKVRVGRRWNLCGLILSRLIRLARETAEVVLQRTLLIEATLALRTVHNSMLRTGHLLADAILTLLATDDTMLCAWGVCTVVHGARTSIAPAGRNALIDISLIAILRAGIRIGSIVGRATASVGTSEG